MKAMSENDIVVSYPENVIEEFAYGRGILFLGSGVSSSAINCEGSRLPGWNKFINESKKLLKSPHTDKIEYIDAMLKHGEMLRALQVIKDYSDSGEYTRKVKQSFLARGYNPSKIHDILRRINSKITITTNFDNIYENYCRSDGALGYVSAEYNDVNKIITNIKSTENLIIKAHGSIENPEKLIFTQNEYFKAHRENALFYEVLHALFTTNTVLFLGYSLQDPDINLLVNSELANMSKGTPHYVLIPESEVDTELKKHWINNFNISVITYKVTDTKDPYTHFEDAIYELYINIKNIQDDRRISPGAIELV